jgi:ubiquinol-cytochrome c reductase cytochrome b subunit
MKDLFATSLFLILFAVFIFFMPSALGHADNYIPANPLQTPPEIVPEWYLLPFYAILRAFDFNIGPIDSKVAGVFAMFLSIGILFVLPWIDTSRVRSMRYRPVARQMFLIFVVVCVTLGWCGGQNPGKVLVPTTFSATLSWQEGGQVITAPVHADSAGDWGSASDAARDAMRAQHASATAVSRHGATDGVATGVIGGTPRTRTITTTSVDELETRINDVKTEVGAAAPFFTVERHIPFTFTVTRLAQLLTLYYFLFFLVLLPVLGLMETPRRVPDTIAKPVLEGAS